MRRSSFAPSWQPAPKLRDMDLPPMKLARPGVFATCEEAGVAQPKHPSTRNGALRELARGEECTLQWGGRCNCHPDTTVWAHDNTLAGNKGGAYKSHDHLGVFAGFECHSRLDQGGDDAATKAAVMTLARKRTHARLEEIAASKTLRIGKVAAAKWALELLGAVP